MLRQKIEDTNNKINKLVNNALTLQPEENPEQVS